MQKICHDLFNISGRIKMIDPAYTIYRNGAKDRLEVYWRGKFAFVIPFDFLDERTLFYTKKTRRENADEIERDLDEGNAQIFQAQAKTIQKLQAKIKDYVKYDFERFN